MNSLGLPGVIAQLCADVLVFLFLVLGASNLRGHTRRQHRSRCNLSACDCFFPQPVPATAGAGFFL